MNDPPHKKSQVSTNHLSTTKMQAEREQRDLSSAVDLEEALQEAASAVEMKSLDELAQEVVDCDQTFDLVWKKLLVYEGEEWIKTVVVDEQSGNENTVYTSPDGEEFESRYDLVFDLLERSPEAIFNAKPDNWDYLWPILEKNGWMRNNNGHYEKERDNDTNIVFTKEQTVRYYFRDGEEIDLIHFSAKEYLSLEDKLGKNFIDDVDDDDDWDTVSLKMAEHGWTVSLPPSETEYKWTRAYVRPWLGKKREQLLEAERGTDYFLDGEIVQHVRNLLPNWKGYTTIAFPEYVVEDDGTPSSSLVEYKSRVMQELKQPGGHNTRFTPPSHSGWIEKSFGRRKGVGIDCTKITHIRLKVCLKDHEDCSTFEDCMKECEQTFHPCGSGKLGSDDCQCHIQAWIPCKQGSRKCFRILASTFASSLIPAARDIVMDSLIGFPQYMLTIPQWFYSIYLETTGVAKFRKVSQVGNRCLVQARDVNGNDIPMYFEDFFGMVTNDGQTKHHHVNLCGRFTDINRKLVETNWVKMPCGRKRKNVEQGLSTCKKCCVDIPLTIYKPKEVVPFRQEINSFDCYPTGLGSVLHLLAKDPKHQVLSHARLAVMGYSKYAVGTSLTGLGDGHLHQHFAKVLDQYGYTYCKVKKTGGGLMDILLSLTKDNSVLAVMFGVQGNKAGWAHAAGLVLHDYTRTNKPPRLVDPAEPHLLVFDQSNVENLLGNKRVSLIKFVYALKQTSVSPVMIMKCNSAEHAGILTSLATAASNFGFVGMSKTIQSLPNPSPKCEMKILLSAIVSRSLKSAAKMGIVCSIKTETSTSIEKLHQEYSPNKWFGILILETSRPCICIGYSREMFFHPTFPLGLDVNNTSTMLGITKVEQWPIAWGIIIDSTGRV